jgi:REP element-mobilizing transposase RayT
VDRLLDRAGHGPSWLRRDDVAQLVADALFFGEQKLNCYRLHAWVVMPNHVHALLTALVPASRLLKSIKGFSAREANKLLGQTGEPFWQRESYDHWVRNQAEFERIAAYIERNPVTAGLARQAEDYRWSSAYKPA